MIERERLTDRQTDRNTDRQIRIWAINAKSEQAIVDDEGI